LKSEKKPSQGGFFFFAFAVVGARHQQDQRPAFLEEDGPQKNSITNLPK